MRQHKARGNDHLPSSVINRILIGENACHAEIHYVSDTVANYVGGLLMMQLGDAPDIPQILSS